MSATQQALDLLVGERARVELAIKVLEGSVSTEQPTLPAMEPENFGAIFLSSPSHSERMKQAWAKRKAKLKRSGK